MKNITDEYMTRQELCDYLKIGGATSIELIRYRVVEAFIIGHRYLISRASVEHLIKETLPRVGNLHTVIEQAKASTENPLRVRVGGKHDGATG